MPRPILFHAMRSSTPTADQFESYEQSGKVVKESWTEEKKRKYRSVSSWDTIEVARDRATRHGQGDWIAEMDLSQEPSIELFGPETDGHWDMLGDSGAMARCTIRVHDRVPHV